jgi:hypothetical protein
MFEAMPDEFMPPALQNQPQLWAENQTLLEAFYRLNSTRQSGMNGAFAISISEINAYCQMFEIEECAEFFNAISACDDVYFKYLKTLDKK